MTRAVVILVTYPKRSEIPVEKFVEEVLHARLAACINAASVTSRYWWQGNLEADEEILLWIKTTEERVPELEHWIRSHHPYQVPEFIVLPVLQINEPYLQWLIHETRSQQK